MGRETVVDMSASETHDPHDELENFQSERRDSGYCPYCQRSSLMNADECELRIELAEKNAEIMQLRREVLDARDQLESITAATSSAQLFASSRKTREDFQETLHGISPDTRAFLPPEPSPLDWPPGLVPAMRATFED